MEGLFHMLNRCRLLKTLVLDIEDIGEILLRTISCCSSLQKLHISHCTASKQHWNTLATRLTNLTDLYISGKCHSILSFVQSFYIVKEKNKHLHVFSDMPYDSLIVLLDSCKSLKRLNTGSTRYTLPFPECNRIHYEQAVLRCHDLVPDLFEICSDTQDN